MKLRKHEKNIKLARHVVLPGIPEHGTPEHRNITEHSGTPPKKPGTPPRKPGTPPRKPGTPQRKPGTPRKKPPKSQKADVPPICYRARELLETTATHYT